MICAASISSISIDAIVNATADNGGGGPYSLRATLGLPQDTPAGTGVGVAVVDSGIASSPDFGDRISAFYDFTRIALPAAPSDGYGHGTHVAGLIASAGSLTADVRYQGLGPKVRLIGMKVLDETGAGKTSDVIRAVETATLLRAVLGIDVINLSLSHPIYERASRDPLVRAVEAASRSGIVVVVAAGNYGTNRATGEVGYGGIASPGNAPSAITVGAAMTQDTTTRRDDRIAPYSSRGPSWYDGFAKPDLVAPGHLLVSNAGPGSTLYLRYPTLRVSSSYLRLSGTSMATAVTSGTVALVIEAHRQTNPNAPPLTPNAVKAILEYTSIPMRDAHGVEYDTLTQGAGALNAAGAIDLTRAIDTTRPTGWYWLTRTLAPATTVAGDAWAWAQRLVWRTQTILGSTIDSNQLAWALTIPWGSSTSTWDSHIVWGSDVVWGDATSTWSSHIVWGSSDEGDHIVWGSSDDPNNPAWGNLAGNQEASAPPDDPSRP